DTFDTSPSLNMELAAEEPPPPIVEAFSPPPDDLRTNIIPFDDFPPTPSSAGPLPPLPPPPRGSSDIRPPLPPAASPIPDVPAPPRPSRSRPIPAESRPFVPERPRPSAAVPAVPVTGGGAAARIRDAIRQQAASLAAKDWSKLLKAEINPRWFLMAAGAVFAFWVVVLSPFFVYSLWVSRPTSRIDAALDNETKDKRQKVAEAQRLFAAGQYDRSLALCRAVLSRSPNNQLARRFAQMSENAL